MATPARGLRAHGGTRGEGRPMRAALYARVSTLG
jgi:hypothetical protein